MNGTATRSLRLGVSVVGLVTLGCVLTGLAAKPTHRGIPLPTDWSHRHLIFSRPGSADQSARLGQDLRYWQQMYRREQRLALPARVAEVDGVAAPAPGFLRVRSHKRFHRDWAEDLGTGASAGAGNYPAKFSFESTTANCGNATTPDFVVYSTGLQGSAGQASIVAYDNLYSGCTGTVPSIYWAYNTSQILPTAVPGAILTSPVLSLDGKQISFVQTDGATTPAAKVVLLKWAASAIETVSLPGIPLQVAPALYATCVAPCMTTFALTNRTLTPTDDTTSSVFYDYGGDVAWVGDSRGILHKFHPFFNGTPAEIFDASWPALVSNPQPLSSPVYDRVTNNVFASGQDGFLYRVDATTAAVVHSRQLDFAISLAGPIVDSARGFVYAFGARDNSSACSGGPCAAVFQLPTNFNALDTGTRAAVGLASPTGPTPTPLFPAGFDNAYLNSVDGTGKIYVCGNTGANATLYQVPIQAGALSDGVAIAVLGTTLSTPTCSPVTDVSDPGANPATPATERAFVSVQSNASTGVCTAGCIVSMIDTPWEASKNYALGQEILVTPGNQTVRRIYIVVALGTSGTSEPHWPDEFGFYKSDPSPGPGAVTWLNQGDPALPIGPWLPNHLYNPEDRILDSNGTVQVVPTTPNGGGTSGAAPPTWSTGPGDRTGDGTVNWANAGKLPMLGMPSSGGTSAIIIDNTVNAGTLAGASQVYFTTLGDQVCGSTGTGGCAIQASQSALQ